MKKALFSVALTGIFALGASSALGNATHTIQDLKPIKPTFTLNQLSPTCDSSVKTAGRC
jgi:hypothetical protein